MSNKKQLSKRHIKAVTAVQRLTGVALTMDEEWFVLEYCKDFNHRRAAEAVGLHPDTGTKWINTAHISEAVRHIYNSQMEASDINAEVVKEEMFMLYKVALQNRNLGVAAKVLDQLARHTHIDAYAAQKVALAADAEVYAALSSGRRRVAALNSTRVASSDDANLLEYTPAQEFNFK